MSETVHLAATSPRHRDSLRPQTPQDRRPAVLELLRQGLKPRDIAQAMRVPLVEVLEVARLAARTVEGSGTP